MWLLSHLGGGGAVQGDGMQIVGLLFQGPAHAPALFRIPSAAPCPPAECGDRNLPLAGEGLTGLHSCEGRKCCRNQSSLSGLKRKLCKERKPGARGFSSLPRYLLSLWGIHCS